MSVTFQTVDYNIESFSTPNQSITYGTLFKIDDEGAFQKLHILNGFPFRTDILGTFFGVLVVERRTFVVGSMLNAAVGEL